MTTYKFNGNEECTIADGNDAVILGYPHHAKVVYVTGSAITKDGKDCAYWLDADDERYIAEKGYSFSDFHDARFREDKKEQFLSKQLTYNLELRISATLDNDGVVGECFFNGKDTWTGEHRDMVICTTGTCKDVMSCIMTLERKFEKAIQDMLSKKGR